MYIVGLCKIVEHRTSDSRLRGLGFQSTYCRSKHVQFRLVPNASVHSAVQMSSCQWLDFSNHKIDYKNGQLSRSNCVVAGCFHDKLKCCLREHVCRGKEKCALSKDCWTAKRIALFETLRQ